MTIACGTDLSDAARPGLDASAALAARLDPDLVALLFVERHEGGGAHDRARALEEAAARLAGEVAPACARHGIPPARQRVLEGVAGEALGAAAEAEGASLLVVSSRGHGAAPLHKLGGTSERVAVESHVPVLVVRDAAPFTAWAREDRPLRVVLGVDWTTTTDGAIRLVRTLRAAGPVDVVAVHVYYPGVSSRYGLEPLGPPNEPDATLEQLVARDLEVRVGELGGAGSVVHRATLGFGRIGDHVLEAVAAERADLVVLGTHATRGYRRLASISSVVLHGCRASVACVPRLRGAHGAAAEIAPAGAPGR